MVSDGPEVFDDAEVEAGEWSLTDRPARRTLTRTDGYTQRMTICDAKKNDTIFSIRFRLTRSV